jgi:hypothetical protein
MEDVEREENCEAMDFSSCEVQCDGIDGLKDKREDNFVSTK